MNYKLRLPLVMMIAVITVVTGVRTMWGHTKLEVGMQAPDFSLVNQDGKVVTLSRLRGNRVAVVFYPKDNSPYCTKQACAMRDNFVELQKAGITIVGLSPDGKEKHTSFKAKYNLPFDLLSADSKTLNAYGVNGWFVIARQTFLVDENGTIVTIIKDVQVTQHAQQILDGFNNHTVNKKSTGTTNGS